MQLPDLIQDFGLAVRQQREALKWSQEQLAAQSHLNRTYLGEIERGQAVASLLTLHKLAQALQVHPPDLLACAEHIRQLREHHHQRLMAIGG